MKIIEATNYKESAIDLLKTEKLVVSDLTADFENFIVALQNEKVIGVAGLEIYDNYGFLRSVAVNPDSRNKGIAGELIKQIEMQAVTAGLKEIYLLTETAPEYFKRKGYVQITRADVPAEVQQSSEFSYACPQSAIVMKKTLIK
jgi:amino-acid N-acetyltransferase